MGPDDLETLFINCLKAFHEFHRAGTNTTDDTAAPIGRKVLNIDQLCEYADLKKTTVYKLTSTGEIPHSKRGKRIYFDRDTVDAWLLSNQRGTKADAERKADDYLLNATRRAR